MNRTELLDYALTRFGTEPEYLWTSDPHAFVLRHQSNRKWFAVVLDVPRARLGLDGDGTTDVLDLKCGPILGGSYIGKPGFLPGYHMNKENWISVLLDGSATDRDIQDLLEISYDLTKGKK